MISSLLFILLLNTFTLSQHSSGHGNRTANRWLVKQFTSLITFGDSYTDENRLNYVLLHNGSPPPPGTFLPEVSLGERMSPSPSPRVNSTLATYLSLCLYFEANETTGQRRASTHWMVAVFGHDMLSNTQDRKPRTGPLLKWPFMTMPSAELSVRT